MQKFNVTRNAINQMSQIISKNNNYIGFMYSATSGGCNGFNFHLELVKSDLPNLNNYKIIINKLFMMISYGRQHIDNTDIKSVTKALKDDFITSGSRQGESSPVISATTLKLSTLKS